MKKPDRNIWTGKVCRTDFDGNFSLTDTDGSVTRSCREADKESPRQEADKAKKQADKYQKRINELAPKVKNMERLAAEFSANPEELLPEAIIVETGKAYRRKRRSRLWKRS